MRNPDWQKIICELVRVVGTKTALSERTGISVSSLSDLSRGASVEPRYSRGHKLIELHEKLCK